MHYYKSCSCWDTADSYHFNYYSFDVKFEENEETIDQELPSFLKNLWEWCYNFIKKSGCLLSKNSHDCAELAFGEAQREEESFFCLFSVQFSCGSWVANDFELD